MQIHFTKQFPWKEPTYFIEKIWSGFALNDFLWEKRNGCWSTELYKEKFPYDYEWFQRFIQATPKIHTIREDKKDRWKAGIPIHYEQWTDKPYRSKCYHFAPVIPCMSVQKIKISWSGNHVLVFVDDMLIFADQLYKLARSGGFDCIEDFFKWFNKDYTGKIIHWTDCKY